MPYSLALQALTADLGPPFTAFKPAIWRRPSTTAIYRYTAAVTAAFRSICPQRQPSAAFSCNF